MVLMAYIMEATPELRFLDLGGDAEFKSEVLGILEGPPVPDGDKVRAMSAMTRLPGGAWGPERFFESAETRHRCAG